MLTFRVSKQHIEGFMLLIPVVDHSAATPFSLSLDSTEVFEDSRPQELKTLVQDEKVRQAAKLGILHLQADVVVL